MSKAEAESTPCGDENMDNQSPENTMAELPFFTSSTTTFNPKPYLPLASSSINRGKAVTDTVKKPEPPVNAAQQKPLDVVPEDPDAVFIRYPNPVLPNPEDYPDGLTYIAFVRNDNWFLDADDFETTDGAKSNRAAYPNALEPPRGWFGDIKKEGKGGDRFQSQDHAFLRCTFCRRGYQGVNAKSMWRRHVLEKHKIPMSNRREGPGGSGEGGRIGRSSNSTYLRCYISNRRFTFTFHTSEENKRCSSIAPMTAPLVPAKLRTAYTVPNLSDLRPFSSRTNQERERTPAQDETKPAKKIAEKQRDSTLQEPIKLYKEPQFVPDEGSKSFSGSFSPGISSQLPPSSPLGEESSHASRIFGLGFADSPNHRIMMPWKFPSPSHPLHCDPEDLCLAVPIRGIAGDGLRAGYVPVQMSPFPGMKTPAGIQFSSPAGPDSPLNRKVVHGRVLGWNRNASKSKLPPFPEPSPVRPYSGPISFGVAPVAFESPELPQSTDQEEGEACFSSMSDWFDFSSPRKGVIDFGLISLPDTPLKRASSTSALSGLQLKSPIKGLSSPRKEPAPNAGLGFNFKVDLSSSISKKRSRSEDEDSNLFQNVGSENPFKRRLRQEDAEEPPLTDAGSEDPSSTHGSSPPLLKRRLTL